MSRLVLQAEEMVISGDMPSARILACAHRCKLSVTVFLAPHPHVL